MADSSPSSESKCQTCGKANSKEDPLNKCARCRSASYCSRDCQKADWKNHKKTCATSAQSNASANAAAAAAAGANASNPSKPLALRIDKPFHRLHEKKWLHNRPEADVYKLLIDTYRLRMADNHNFNVRDDADSIYGGATDGGEAGFRRFLQMAESKGVLLPDWWVPVKRAECIETGLNGDGGWSDLSRKVTKQDIMQHYGDENMPMQMRLFGEQVIGSGPGGQSGTTIMRMQMMAEGGGLESRTLDVSHMMFGR